MIRFIDFILSFLTLIFLSPLAICLILVELLFKKKIFFFQTRVGQREKPFVVIKLRTLKVGTPNVATHKLSRIEVTKFGLFLRKSKLDELPQLWNVFRGEMSFVGPRPGLPSQEELITERRKYDLFRYKPGITGLAQLNRIDMSNPEILAKTDHIMMKHLNILSYIRYLYLTFMGEGTGDNTKKDS